jgi:hypothetical protein
MLTATHVCFDKDFAASQSHVEGLGTERKRSESTSLRTRRPCWVGGVWARTAWPTSRALKGRDGQSWRARWLGFCVWAFWTEEDKVQLESCATCATCATCFCLTKYYNLRIGSCKLYQSTKNFNHGRFSTFHDCAGRAVHLAFSRLDGGVH